MKDKLVSVVFALSGLLIALLSVAVADEVQTDSSSFPAVSGPYLGQTPPGEEPQPFAPGLIPVEGIQHCYPTVSPDGREVYWMQMEGRPPKGKILFTKEVNGQWTQPAVAEFSGAFNDHSPIFSIDGNRIYFSSARPDGHGRGDIYYVERNDSGWSDAVNLGVPPNGEGSEGQVSFTSGGDCYFVSSMDSVKWGRGIYRCRYEAGRYLPREALPESINSDSADIYPFVAADGSYLMFGSGRPGLHDVETEIYICFLKEDGGWTEPQNMGEAINNGHTATFPYVTPDGKYMLFNRFNEDGTDAFYWVDVRIIEQLRPGS